MGKSGRIGGELCRGRAAAASPTDSRLKTIILQFFCLYWFWFTYIWINLFDLFFVSYKVLFSQWNAHFIWVHIKLNVFMRSSYIKEKKTHKRMSRFFNNLYKTYSLLKNHCALSMSNGILFKLEWSCWRLDKIINRKKENKQSYNSFLYTFKLSNRSVIRSVYG